MSASTSSGEPPVRTADASPPRVSSRTSTGTRFAAPPTRIGRSWLLPSSRMSPKTPATLIGRATPGSALAAVGRAADVDREQDAHRGQVRDHRRAADADERQRDARDRRDPHRHTDVDADLEQERERDAAGDDRRERIARHRDDAQPTPDDEQVEAEQDRRA